MNKYTDAIDKLIEDSEEYTRKEEVELVEHIFEHSSYMDEYDYAKAKVTYHDALEKVQESSDFEVDAIEFLDKNGLLPLEKVVELSSSNTNELAYDLAYNNIDVGIKLFKELAYYHSIGRLQ